MTISETPTPPPLVVQTDDSGKPTLAPTRKWLFGATGAAIVTALIPVLFPLIEGSDATWGPVAVAVLGAILGALGFAVPAYVAKNRAAWGQP